MDLFHPISDNYYYSPAFIDLFHPILNTIASKTSDNSDNKLTWST